MKRLLPLAAFVLLSLSRPWERSGTPAPLAPNRVIASLLPERCRVYVEGPGLSAVFLTGSEHPFLATLASTPLGRALHQEGRAPGQLLARADAWLGEPLLPLLHDMTERGVALGFDPALEKSVLVARAADESAAQRALSSLFAGIERQFGLKGAFLQPHARQGDAELWFLGDGVVARRGELVVLGNERELLAEVLDLAADPLGRGLLARPGLEAQRSSRPADTLLWAWLEMEELGKLGDEGLRELRKASVAPGAQGLLGAGLSALFGGRALSASLSLGRASLELRSEALDAALVPALSPGARGGERPTTIEGPSLGQALLYRDYASFLAQRAELFPVEAQPRFAEAVTTGALFFGGRDLGTEVLPHLSPWIRLVARNVAFPAERRPEITLPGLAAIGVLDDPLEGEAWTTALQSLIAILGVERAQRGEQGLRLRLYSEEGVEISSACFPTLRTGEGIDLKYNLEPAVAVVGQHLVVGTHVALVRELVRELARRPARAEPQAEQDGPEHLQLDPHGLAAVVAANGEALRAHKVLSEGLEPAAAAREVEGLRLVLASLAGARIEVRGSSTSAPEAVLTLTLPPSDER